MKMLEEIRKRANHHYRHPWSVSQGRLEERTDDGWVPVTDLTTVLTAQQDVVALLRLIDRGEI